MLGFLRSKRNNQHIESIRDLTDSVVDGETINKESVFFQSLASADSLIDNRIDSVPRSTVEFQRSTDFVEAVKLEEETNSKKEDNRLRKWQAIVFLMACFRLYMVNACNITNGQVAVSSET